MDGVFLEMFIRKRNCFMISMVKEHAVVEGEL